MAGHSAFNTGDHFVANTNVGKGPPHHDFMIAATRAIGVKIATLNATPLEIASGRTVSLNAPRRRNMVGRHGISQHGEDPRTVNIDQRFWVGFHIVKER
ncbi:hypothetical protein D3C72_1998340 [compost metagenome]